MNGQLNKSIVNPELASAISFALIAFFFIGRFLILPRPLPTAHDLEAMPWWAVIEDRLAQCRSSLGLRS